MKIKYTKMDAGLAKYFRDNAARQMRKANSKVDVDQLGNTLIFIFLYSNQSQADTKFMSKSFGIQNWNKNAISVSTALIMIFSFGYNDPKTGGEIKINL